MEGLTGEVRFNEHGRRRNFTLQIVEMSLNSILEKAGSWSDVSGLTIETQPKAMRVIEQEIDRNRTYIVTSIIVSFVTVNYFSQQNFNQSFVKKKKKNKRMS